MVVFQKLQLAVDPPNIGAVAAANVDIAAPGVNIGDVVIPEPPATLEAGLCPQGATVVAKDSIRLRITNPSAGAIDGANLLWNFTIIRAGPDGNNFGGGIAWAG